MAKKNFSIDTYIHAENRDKVAAAREYGWSKWVGACLNLFQDDYEVKQRIIHYLETPPITPDPAPSTEKDSEIVKDIIGEEKNIETPVEVKEIVDRSESLYGAI